MRIARVVREFLIVLALALSGACQPSGSADAAGPAPDPAPGGFADLGPGWHDIAPGGETICSDGTPYRFFVRRGDPARLLVYFQGGGACWFAGNCHPELQPSYKRNVLNDDPARHGGIFDFADSRNPFRAHSIVYVPYCTADVHIGDNVVTYEAPPDANGESRTVTIHHRGFANAQAALDWTFTHIVEPQTIFVTGSSAGAIPSPYYAMLIGDAYPDARIAQLGDGAGGYRRQGSGPAPHVQWGTVPVLAQRPEFGDLSDEAFTYELLYVTAAERLPDATFAQLDTAEDVVQKQFLAMGGLRPPSLLELLTANHDDIRRAVPNFRAFIAGGELHTLLARPEFYTYGVGEVTVHEWVDALAAGRDVPDVRCTDCAVPEVSE
jgi:hypothetical protein